MRIGRPERILLYFCLAVAAAAGYDLFLQYSAVPSAMRHVPPANAAYVVTSPLRSLWNGMRPHIGPFFEDEPAARDAGKPEMDTTPARNLARDVKRMLADKAIVLREPDDLAALGVDPDAHAAVAILGSLASPRLLVVVPVIDREKFRQTLAKLVDASIVDEDSPGEHARARLFKAGDVVFGFGPDGAAVLSDDADVVARALAGQADNLAYHRGNDRAQRGFADLQSGNLTAAAWLRGHIAWTEPWLPLVRDVQFAMSIDERAARWRARTTLAAGRAEALDRILAAPLAAGPLADRVLTAANGAIVAADDSLPYFMRYLSSAAAADRLAGFHALFPGLLDELRTLRTFDRLSIAAIDESRRVPGVVLGLRLSREEADDLVFRLQRAVRVKRDRDILAAAARRYREESDAQDTTRPTVDALLARGLLSEERHALWRRYRFQGGEPVADPPLAPADFDHDAYRREAPPMSLRYILPPVTRDDFEYRFAPDRDRIDQDALRRDVHRLCSGYVDDTLWLGNDAAVLALWLERLRVAGDDGDAGVAVASPRGAEAPKLSAFARPRELFDSGRLHPDAEVNERVRTLLSDLRQYRTLHVTASTRSRERQIDVAGTFLLF